MGHRLKAKYKIFLPKRTCCLMFIAMLLLTCAKTQAWTGTGTIGDPYQINSVADLATLATEVNGGNAHSNEWFKITATYPSATALPASWTPVGTQTNPFRGNFDGGSTLASAKYITGASLNNSGAYRGLFGCTEGGIIQNVDIRNMTIGPAYIAVNYRGALCGYASGTVFTNCKSTGGTIYGGRYLGGLIGYAVGCTITDCSSSTSIISNEYNGDADVCLGGLAGYLETTNEVSNCFATGVITGKGANKIGGLFGWYTGGATAKAGDLVDCYRNAGEINGNVSGSYIGGLVGYMENNNPTRANVTNCYSTTFNINSGKDYIGGIVGYAAGSFSFDSCRTANVRMTTSSSTIDAGTGGLIGYANHPDFLIENCHADFIDNSAPYSTNTGGLIGYLITDQTIRNCYTTGTMNDGNSVGGLIGHGENFSLENCHADMDISVTMATTSVGGLIGSANNIKLISNCYTTGIFTSTSAETTHVGGLIGYLVNSSASLATEVTKCFSTVFKGNRSSSFVGNNVGGLIGSISNSSTVPVKLTMSYYPGLEGLPIDAKIKMGGLVGSISGAYLIEGCYSTGNLRVDMRIGTYVGGIAGDITNNGSILYSVAAGDAVVAQSNYGRRIYANTFGTQTTTSNLANSGMQLNVSSLDAQKDGISKSWAELTDEATYSGMGSTWTFFPTNASGNWRSGKDISMPYLPTQSSPVKMSTFSTGTLVMGIYNPNDPPETINIYNYTRDMALLGTATMLPNGTWNLVVTSGSVAGSDYLIAQSLTEGRIQSLVGVSVQRTSWFRSLSDGAFESEIWQQSDDAGASWTRENRPVAVPAGGAAKVIAQHNLSFANTNNNYSISILRIETSGILNLTAGELSTHVIEIVSSETSAAQLINDGCELATSMMTVERSFNAGRWYMFSVPYEVQSVTNLSGKERIRSVNGEPAHYFVKYYDGLQRTISLMDNINGSGVDWRYIASDGLMQPCSGYQVATGVNNTLLFSSKNEVAQEACNIATRTFSTGLYPCDLPQHAGWNLVGNPYTMNFNLRNISPQYVCYVYQPATNNYITLLDEDYWLRPFTPFFVQATEPELAVGGQELRSQQLSTETVKINIRLSDDVNTDVFRIHLRSDATTGYDLNKDGQKIFGSTTTVPQLYGLAGSSQLAINALPLLGESAATVPLGYYIPVQDEYHISLGDQAELYNITAVLLKDKTMGMEVDLMTTDYPFTLAQKETNNSRFELRIIPRTTTTGITAAGDRNIQVVAVGKDFVINGLCGETQVVLYDLTGKAVGSYSGVKNDMRVPTGLSGIYLIKATNQNQYTTQKVIFK